MNPPEFYIAENGPATRDADEVPARRTGATLKRDTAPSREVLCIMLAQRDHKAGELLARICYWAKYSSAKIPRVTGYWVANKREWWMREACLSADQFDRCLAKLAGWKLVERRQWWFGGRNILHVRPTEQTTNFLTLAMSWQTAKELLEDMIPCKIAKQSSVKTRSLNEISKTAKHQSAILRNPNYVRNLHEDRYEKLADAPSASPPCVSPKSRSFAGQTEFAGEEESVTINRDENQSTYLATSSRPGAGYKDVFSVWQTSVEKFHFVHGSKRVTSRLLKSRERRALAEFIDSLGCPGHLDGTVHDLRAHACDIIRFCVSHWEEFVTKETSSQPFIDRKAPDPLLLCLNVSAAVRKWTKAGQPSL